MLTEADESIGQCKKTAGKFSLHLRILQNWIPQVFSVSIPHQHAFFKNTPLLCLEWISVTWSWLPTFPLPDCRVQALPGAGGRESWTPGSAASSIHWETGGDKILEGHFRNLSPSLSPPRQSSSCSLDTLSISSTRRGGRLQSWRCSRPVGN